jgi:hypothetical protein
MAVLEGKTITIGPDEAALWLVEANQKSDDQKSERRVQIITVVRNDINGDQTAAFYQEDLGPADSFTCELFQIPGGQITKSRSGKIVKIESWETVASIRSIAEDMHAHFTKPTYVELGIGPQNLMDRYYEVAQEKARMIRRIRDGYPI